MNSSSGYNPDLADQAVKWQRLLFDARFYRVSFCLIGFFWHACLDKFWRHGRLPLVAANRQAAARLRRLLVDLGPTFVKIGQFVSVRRDLLPDEIADQLSLLTDKVPPFGLEIARCTIQAELGAEPEQIFSRFEPEPMASASIGQVYRACLPDGRLVAVKVQRPNLKNLLYQDLGYARLFARICVLLGNANARDWLAISDQFGRTIFAETDYLQEGRHADRLSRVMRAQPSVKIPRVIWKHTGRRVITFEYLPGWRIDQVEQIARAGLDLRRLANLLIESYLEQVVVSGFFHADPHAGNLAVDKEGNLIIYDFGMMGELSANERSALADCVRAITKKDALKLSERIFQLGVLKDAQFVEPLAKSIQPLIDYYFGRDLLDIDFKNVETEINRMLSRQALCLPPALVCLLRVVSLSDGIARTLQPGFSFARAARPFIRRLMFESILN